MNVTQGKNFDKSGSRRPVDRDRPTSSIPAKPLRVMTRVNGELRQDDTTDRLTWGFAWLINYISTFATLKPGDHIWTGTPTGAGVHRNPAVWLKPGDVVEVEVAADRRAAQQGGGRGVAARETAQSVRSLTRLRRGLGWEKAGAIWMRFPLLVRPAQAGEATLKPTARVRGTAGSHAQKQNGRSRELRP